MFYFPLCPKGHFALGVNLFHGMFLFNLLKNN